MNIELSSHFLKQARKLSREEKIKLSDRTEWFKKDSYDPRLKTHALTGKLKGILSFSVTHSKRVSFTWVSKNTALFLSVGLHGEVYRK
jgi:mRNA-degrading endonuclease YafQ of YafQ-DinJ toxin-antitoxin module